MSCIVYGNGPGIPIVLRDHVARELSETCRQGAEEILGIQDFREGGTRKRAIFRFERCSIIECLIGSHQLLHVGCRIFEKDSPIAFR